MVASAERQGRRLRCWRVAGSSSCSELSPPEDDFRITYVLLHTFAHVLIRELALEVWLQRR